MAWNTFKVRGTTKNYSPDAGGNVSKGLPVFGIVKDNIDPIRMGRLQVYIADLSMGDSDNEDSWITVNYMSPFYGRTEPRAPENDWGDYKNTSHSYGVWNAPPDIGTTVICLFVNGDTNFGYYIGCVPEPEALHMVPAIGAHHQVILNSEEAQSYGGVDRLPVTNINTNNDQLAEGADYLDAPKPVHSYQAGIMMGQGVLRDKIRGPIGTSSQRETPSRVGWGVSSPGRPIYEGGYTDESIVQASISDGNNVEESNTKTKVIARRGGHSIVMDDGDIVGRDQMIRLRTSMGHQILMSDDGQCISILHSNGQTYVELGVEGTVDIYAANSVNIRTEGDLNLHADNDVNINAGRQLNMTGKAVELHATEKDLKFKSSGAINSHCTGNYTVLSTGGMTLSSLMSAWFTGVKSTYITGLTVRLNSGFGSTVPLPVPALKRNKLVDTLWDNTKGWHAAPNKIDSIVTRAPAHMPWELLKRGAPVSVNQDSDSVLPQTPSPEVQAANKASEQNYNQSYGDSPGA